MDASGLTRRRFVRNCGRCGPGAHAAGRLGGVAPDGRRRGRARRRPPGFRDADYWAFADRVAPMLDRYWSPARRHYAVPGGGETSANADLLYLHAAAARAGHRGACRDDARARALAVRLLDDPPCRVPVGASAAAMAAAASCSASERARATGDQTHDWGWGSTMGTTGGQHAVIDTAVVRGLAMAYMAREQIGLTAAEATHIREHVRAAAYNAFYFYPALRLNQINWPIEIYAAAADVTGDERLLRNDCRAQLSRFARALTRPMPPWQHPVHRTRLPLALPPAVLGPAPAEPRQRRVRDDRLPGRDVLRPRPVGGHAGARPLRGRDDPRVARARPVRLLDARRLPQLGHRALVRALAPVQEARPVPALADGDRARGAPAAVAGPRAVGEAPLRPGAAALRADARRVGRAPTGGALRRASHGAWRGDAELYAARMLCNAAMAATRGLGRLPAETPPPLYAYDPDIGRLAITTPHYNTAILAVNRGAVPYGGMEPARLFDGDQRVAASIGGRPYASFGMVVTDHASGHRTETQRGRARPDFDDPPLRLTRAPRGTRPTRKYPRHAYAGPFETIVAEGWTTGPTVRVRSRHRFEAAHIESSWSLVPRTRTRSPQRAPALPDLGRRGDRHRRRPRRVAPRVAQGPRRPRARGVVRAHGPGRRLRGRALGSQAACTRAHLLHPAAQSSAPDPGPTLAVELLDGERLRRIDVTMRYAPARDAAAAARVGARLRSEP